MEHKTMPINPRMKIILLGILFPSPKNNSKLTKGLLEVPRSTAHFKQQQFSSIDVVYIGCGQAIKR
jgi:hypothetical protein